MLLTSWLMEPVGSMSHSQGLSNDHYPEQPLPDVLCDPTDLIWSKGIPFEAMTGRTAPSSDGLLPEVFWGFPRL